MYYKFNEFKKMALFVFGDCEKDHYCDRLRENLRTAAELMNNTENSWKLRKLADRLEHEVYFVANLRLDMKECDNEILQAMCQDAEKYRKGADGTLLLHPWKNYCMAQIVNDYCTADINQSLLHLNDLREAVANPEFALYVSSVHSIVSCIRDFCPDSYKDFRNKCQDIVHRGELCKKKGQAKYRQFICQTVFPMPDWQ